MLAEQLKLTRREFLQMAAAGTASLLLDITPNIPLTEEQITTDPLAFQQTEEPEADMIPEAPEQEGAQEKNSAFDLIDIGTASIVAEEFARHVLVRGAAQGNSLNAGTALEMNALALSRIQALKTWGGEEGEKLAEEEAHELFHSETYPVALLVAFSDWSNTHLAFDSDATFSEIAEMQLKPAIERQQRPDIDTGSAEEWKQYLEAIKEQLYQESIEIAASTSVLGGITTYASSSLANQQKDRVLQSCWEKQYAERILESKEQGAKLDDEAKAFIYQTAVEQANELMNGTQGFSKLCMAGPSNADGVKQAGDPPQIYFALRNPNLKAIVVEETVGVIQEGLSTLTLNAMWLKKAGVTNNGERSVGNAMRAILNREAHVYKAIGEKLTSLMKRGERQDFMETIRQALQQVEDESAVQEIGKLLDMIPPSKLDPNIGEYVQNRARILQRLVTGKAGDPIIHFAESLLTIDHEHISVMWESLRGKVDISDPNTLLKIEKEVLKIQPAFPHTSIVHALETLTMESSADQEQTNRTQQGKSGIANQEKASLYAITINSIVEHIQGLNSGNATKLVDTLLQHAEGVVNPGKVIKNSEPDTIASILQRIKAAPKPAQSNHNHNSNGNHEQQGTIEQAKHVLNDKTDRFLDAIGLHHHAKEVFYALCTQLPAVASIVRLGKRSLIDVHQETHETEQDKQSMRYILTEIIAKNIAETAGSESIYGNGPNFSQEVFELSPTEKTSTGDPVITRRNMRPAESLVHKNAYAMALNAVILGMGIGTLVSLAPKEKRGEAAVTFGAIAAAENAKSAFADNVAAYLFGAAVMHAKMNDFYKEHQA